MPKTTITIMEILERISKGAHLPNVKQYGWSAIGMCNDLANLYRNYPSQVITVTQDENIETADSDQETGIFFNLDHPSETVGSSTVMLFAVKSRIPHDSCLWVPVLNIFESPAEVIMIKTRIYPGSKEWRIYRGRLNKVKRIGKYVLWLTSEEYQDYDEEMVCLADDNELLSNNEAVILPFNLRKPH